MKKLIPAFLFLSLLLASACNPSKSTEQGSADETTAAAQQEDTSAAMTETQEPAEDKSQRPSPPRQATGAAGGAQITIDYGSPSVRGREIWGALVPYGEVWRTGANEATTISLDKDVMVEGKKLPAGKYSVFTIPNKDKWTIIFNSVTEQWGAYEYNQAKDALRVDVKPKMTDKPVEALEFTVNGDGFVIRWEKVEVPVKVTAA